MHRYASIVLKQHCTFEYHLSFFLIILSESRDEDFLELSWIQCGEERLLRMLRLVNISRFLYVHSYFLQFYIQYILCHKSTRTHL